MKKTKKKKNKNKKEYIENIEDLINVIELYINDYYNSEQYKEYKKIYGGR